VQNETGWQSQHCNAASIEPSVAPGVALWTILDVVGLAVHLHCKTLSGAIEVQNVRSDRVLPPEAQALEGKPPQTLPEEHFWQAHVASQLTSATHRPSRYIHAVA
jgi:hypothetical protein